MAQMKVKRSEVTSVDKKLAYVKPDYTLDREKERKLAHIATRGVTQLFNAVAERQKFLDEKAAELVGKPRQERKRIVDEMKQYHPGDGLTTAKGGGHETKAAKRQKQSTTALAEPKKEEEEDSKSSGSEFDDLAAISSGIEDTDIEVKQEQRQ